MERHVGGEYLEGVTGGKIVIRIYYLKVLFQQNIYFFLKKPEYLENRKCNILCPCT